MFKNILFKELHENILDLKFIIAALLCIIIIPLGFYINKKDYENKKDNYRESVRIYFNSHKTLGDISRFGAAAFRAPSPYSLLSAGMEQLLPTSINTIGSISNMGVQVELINERGLDSAISFIYGRLDLSFIVSVVMSLLAMLFTYNSIAGEKERRTLSQIFSNSVPRNIVILAKMTAGAFLIGTVFLLGILFGFIVLMVTGQGVFSADYLFGRILIGTAFSLLNILVFLNLGLMISGLNKTTLSAIISLMSCWVFLFLLWPKMSVVAAKIIRPVQSQQIVDLEKNQVLRQIKNEENHEIDGLRKTMLGVRDMTSVEFFDNLRKGEKDAKAFEKKQKKLLDLFRIRSAIELEKIDIAYENRKYLQAEIARDLSRLSPASCFIHILAEISNTGFCEYKEWQKLKYRLKDILERDVGAKMESLRFENLSVVKSNADRKAPSPYLEYRDVPLDKAISAVWADIVILFVYSILFFAGAHTIFLRYDVR